MSAALKPTRRQLAALAFTALAGLATPARADTVSLGEADDGRVLTLRPGDRIEVNLASNPSTGYVWAFETIGPNVFAAFTQGFEAGPAMPGAGGRHKWSFTVGTAGKTRLAFRYLRPWEGEGSAVRRLTVDVIVP